MGSSNITFSASINDKRVMAKLEALSKKEVKEICRKAARKVAKEVVLPEVKRTTPWDTGGMMASMKVKAIKRSRSSVGVVIGTSNQWYKGDDFYIAFVEFGRHVGKRTSGMRRVAAPKIVPGKKRRGRKALGRETDTRKWIEGKHTIEKSYETTKERGLAMFEQEVAQGIEKKFKEM